MKVCIILVDLSRQKINLLQLIDIIKESTSVNSRSITSMLFVVFGQILSEFHLVDRYCENIEKA